MHSITFCSSVLIVSFVRPTIYQLNYDLVTSGLLFLRVICDLREEMGLGEGDRSQKTLVKIKYNVTIKYFCEAYMVVEFLLIFFWGSLTQVRLKSLKLCVLNSIQETSWHDFRFF
jgi:hypothetical protein